MHPFSHNLINFCISSLYPITSLLRVERRRRHRRFVSEETFHVVRDASLPVFSANCGNSFRFSVLGIDLIRTGPIDSKILKIVKRDEQT